ncbi:MULTISPECIES: UxaA family hydrolase [unclassified Cytobacillus]|uniref:UxaA family hydrolase n=1 Tax=unclassified Cytobacillus TaxID=2675268 RepID=UPI00135CD12E|nr:UxaA family hydrolase [Cytobacillus sp. AMY 15.2]KAF0818952.1 Altronate dehydratase [Bacillus sp. ZZV12-4809]MCM3092493.1 UxaA family hydrolase [Cytobacillus sp. AMY 15.2]
MSEYKTLFLNERDSVAVALSDIPAGAEVMVKADGIEKTVRILEPIQFGHKFAVRAIPQGDDIIKYGEVIGAAIAPIDAGEHVHVHNLEGKRGRGDKIVQ